MLPWSSCGCNHSFPISWWSVFMDSILYNSSSNWHSSVQDDIDCMSCLLGLGQEHDRKVLCWRSSISYVVWIDTRLWNESVSTRTLKDTPYTSWCSQHLLSWHFSNRLQIWASATFHVAIILSIGVVLEVINTSIRAHWHPPLPSQTHCMSESCNKSLDWRYQWQTDRSTRSQLAPPTWNFFPIFSTLLTMQSLHSSNSSPNNN